MHSQNNFSANDSTNVHTLPLDSEIQIGATEPKLWKAQTNGYSHNIAVLDFIADVGDSRVYKCVSNDGSSFVAGEND